MSVDNQALLGPDFASHPSPEGGPRNAFLPVDIPDVDEFDLDLRLGELADFHPRRVGWTPFDAQTDGQGCMPTGAGGAGGTCNTNDNTCPATCAGLNTCPNTCGNTCPNTCANTCPDTCPNTCDNATCLCEPTVHDTHCPTCRCNP